MTTSGSRNFTVSRAEIIEEAVANIGVLDPGNTLSAEEEARANLRLNLMIKGWMAKGANLWRREELVLYLQSGQRSYQFGTDHFAKIGDTVETTILADAVAPATLIRVVSTAGMVSGDLVGIKLDDNSIYWSVGGATVTNSTTLTLSVGLPSAVSVGRPVYSYPYTTAAGGVNTTVNPVKVAFAYRRDPDGTDTTVRLIGREEYAALSRKGASGPVTDLCHDRQLTSKLLVWPAVDTNNDKLILIVDRVIEDFDTVADNPDFPVEWLNALMWGLSAELANNYGLPISERQWLKASANAEFNSANSFDIDDATVRFEYAEQ